MEKLTKLTDFLTETYMIEGDDNFNEDVLNEIFSSDFFDKEEMIAEKRKLEEEPSYQEYKRIKQLIKKQGQHAELTKEFFALEEQAMEYSLEQDRTFIKVTTDKIIERLQILTEDAEEDDDLNIKRKEKLDLVKSYRRKTLYNITREITEMKKFYQTNPKILVL